MFDWLKKLLLGSFLAPIWTWLSGKKTIAGVIITLLSIIGSMVGDSGMVQIIIDILREKTLTNPMLTSGEIVLIVGILHKIWKFFKGEKTV